MKSYSIQKDRNIYSSKVEILPPPLSPLYEEDVSSEDEDEIAAVNITSPFSHIDYIKSIKKDRPLPQLPPQLLPQLPPPLSVHDHKKSTVLLQDSLEENGRAKPSVHGDEDCYDRDDFYDQVEIKQNRNNKKAEQPQLEDQASSLIDDVQELIEINRALTSPPSSPTLPPVNKERTMNKNIFPFDPTTTMTSSSLLEDIKPYRRMASKANDSQIQFTFAIYLISLLTRKESKQLGQEAVYWIDKLAKQNYPEALYIKGTWYLNPPTFTDIRYSFQKALKYFQHAAKLGLTEAYYQIAEMYKEENDQNAMIMNYEMAASKNHTLALYKLANIFLRGLYHQEKDIPLGIYYLKKAADTEESAVAAYELGCIYANQLELIDIESDPQLSELFHDITDERNALAMQYLNQAYYLGLASAGYLLGDIHAHMKLGLQDADMWKAYQYYASAAEKGHEGAMLVLSNLFLQGVPGHLRRHPSVAFKLCYRAAVRKNDNKVAEYTLGTYYELGIGVSSNTELAFKWYHEAARKGYEPAKKKVNVLNQGETRGLSRTRSYIDQSMRMIDKYHKKNIEQPWNMM